MSDSGERQFLREIRAIAAAALSPERIQRQESFAQIMESDAWKAWLAAPTSPAPKIQ